MAVGRATATNKSLVVSGLTGTTTDQILNLSDASQNERLYVTNNTGMWMDNNLTMGSGNINFATARGTRGAGSSAEMNFLAGGTYQGAYLKMFGGTSVGDFDVFVGVYPTTTSIVKFRVDAGSGNTYTNDGSLSSLSDKRIKKDVTDLADGLEVLNSLRPITYKWNGKGEFSGTDTTTIHYGFIADEVLEVAPQYVVVKKGNLITDRIVTKVLDKEVGSPTYNTEVDSIEEVKEEVDDLKSMSTTRMIPMMFKAIQELSAKVTVLENA
jgi:hypothetical protein